MGKLFWLFMAVVFAIVVWWSIGITNYIVNGGLAHDSGHFVKQFKEAQK